MSIQALMDMMDKTERATRGRYQMTLGRLLEKLATFPAEATVIFGGQDTGTPADENSYRGYYSDLSFSIGTEPVAVEAFQKQCLAANGLTYQGYKGGDYVMGEDTPLWAAQYGCCGNAIMDAVLVDGKVVLLTKNVEA
jgi:hypothetical protein